MTEQIPTYCLSPIIFFGVVISILVGLLFVHLFCPEKPSIFFHERAFCKKCGWHTRAPSGELLFVDVSCCLKCGAKKQFWSTDDWNFTVETVRWNPQIEQFQNPEGVVVHYPKHENKKK